MKKFLFLIVSFIFLFQPQQIQAQARRLEKADQAFKDRQYSEALDLYRKAYRKVQRKDRREGVRVLFQTGMCHKYLNEPSRAEAFFRRAIRGNYPDPVAILYYAQMLHQNGKYDEAAQQYALYSEKVPDDWRGPNGVESIKVAREILENPGLYEVNLPKAFNSRFDDFAPAFGDNRNSILIFTSSRDGAVGTKQDAWTGQNRSSLFVSYEDRKGDWGTPVLLDEGPINTEFNEGAPSVNASGTQLFFTRCMSIPNTDMGCRIFTADRQGPNWGEPSEVVLVADSTISVGHPAISPDEMRLYFVSDMPGGYGGKDIWYAERRSPNGAFENPRNLGPLINTPGDEMFPYVKENGDLYFSSNGHPGLGGMDIFVAKMDGNSWEKPENLGIPINSQADDFGIVFKKGTENGYFSSNRSERGTRGDAIFSFNLAPVEFTISGIIRDDSTKTILPGAQIQLIGSDGSFAQAESDEKGAYKFDKSKIKQNTSYQLLVSKNKYFNQRGQETTLGIVRSRDFVYDFYLAPIPYTPIELPEILYDFARWELLPQYQDSLNGLIRTLQDNPTITVEIASHTDSRGTDASNDTLSQRRAQSVVDYLIERGIDSRRLVAAGYGKRVPRTIDKTIRREGFTFNSGTVLTENYIRSLPTERHRDVAHQLNRRTEFRVLSDDFVPDRQRIDTPPVQIQIRDRNN
jgi:peptidoglycan-associated lipoprotein